MPASGESRVWSCRRCGRQVPAGLSTCRCGFPREKDSAAPPAAPRFRRVGLLLLIASLFAAAAVLFLVARPPRNEAPRSATEPPRDPPVMRNPIVTITGSEGGATDAPPSEYEVAVASLARLADGVDASWERYRQTCAPYASGEPFGRDWFGVWSSRLETVPQPVPECGALLREILTAAGAIRTGMEAAAGGNLDPSAARDVRRTYRMDWSGWARD